MRTHQYSGTVNSNWWHFQSYLENVGIPILLLSNRSEECTSLNDLEKISAIICT